MFCSCSSFYAFVALIAKVLGVLDSILALLTTFVFTAVVMAAVHPGVDGILLAIAELIAYF